MKESAIKFEMHEVSRGWLVLRCNGGLSWEDRELLAASVEEYFRGGPAPSGVVIDLQNVSFINSAGLGALFQLVQKLRGSGGGLGFANIPPTFARLFDTVGLSRVAVCGDDVDDALERLKQRRADTPDGDPHVARTN